jgi:hypothetical protein
MILTVSGDVTIEDPTDHDIRAALESFEARNVEDSNAFVILSQDDWTYIQSGGYKGIGFDLEFQEGDLDHHYRATREDFTLDDIASILSAYRAGNPEWKDMAQWKRLWS